MHQRILAALVIVAALSAMLPADDARSAQNANPLTALAGSWSGSGTARFDGGQSERLTCRGHYTVKNRGAGLGLALRCASSSANIDLRSLLNYQGGRIKGSWEERTFNTSGEVTGQASEGNLRLAIDGGGFTGTMTVTFTGSSQSVSISTPGTGFKGATITLKKY